MNGNEEKIKDLYKRLEMISHKQNLFLKEIRALREEIYNLQQGQGTEMTYKPTAKPIVRSVSPKSKVTTDNQLTQKQKDQIPNIQLTETPPIDEEPKEKQISLGENLEQFIGENLISKVGILIMIIGVIIGAKYSIENDLVSPLTRIILGYFVGVGLLGFGVKLKEKYENYSAVLVSGAIAIMYFITFAAYSFYGLFPQMVAFVMMVMFTIFTVIAAISYDKPVIAHIGLVGAYAVPFFLSNGSGDMLTFFSYVAIINVGILVIAFRKYWKSLYYAAFGFTWVIYLAWFFTEYSHQMDKYFGVAVSFSIVFFAIFYATFLTYKLIKKENFNVVDVVLILLNSFIFYGVGYVILEFYDTTRDYLGLFTLVNAVVHFGVSSLIYKQKLYDKNLFYLVLGLVLTFVTIAIPVQLDGNWVTLLWTAEATLFFWIGRTKGIIFYEKIAYALMTLATLSLAQDWTENYIEYYNYYEESPTTITPLFNIQFLTSLLFIGAFGFINYLYKTPKYKNPFEENGWSKPINFLLPAILLVTTYSTFWIEISNYFTLIFENSRIKIVEDGDYETYDYNYDLLKTKTIWLLNYTLAFLTILSFINIKKLKNQSLGFINLVLNGVTIAVFLLMGIYELAELQHSYFNQNAESIYAVSSFNITLKYISFAFLAGLLYAFYRYTKTDFMLLKLRIPFDLLLHISILAIISSEFLVWMETYGATKSSKLGLSIIWGIYALIIIALGIWKKKKHLRIGAIALFGLTLVKLFFYDISHLETIAKTIVLVALGLLLLIISFLYNKYKHMIFDEDEA